MRILNNATSSLVDSIEANVETAAVHVEEGRNQLQKAKTYQVMFYAFLNDTTSLEPPCLHHRIFKGDCGRNFPNLEIEVNVRCSTAWEFPLCRSYWTEINYDKSETCDVGFRQHRGKCRECSVPCSSRYRATALCSGISGYSQTNTVLCLSLFCLL